MPDTILVVDDQSHVLNILQKSLTEQGFRVITAADGQEGLRITRDQLPDLILLDVNAPIINGYQFLRILRHENRTPVILLTEKKEEADAVKGLELGADDYVAKPVQIRELRARIDALLR